MADQNEQNQPTGANLVDQERTADSMERIRSISGLGSRPTPTEAQ